MGRLHFIRTRLIPATLTAAGVTLVASGLLTYTQPVTATSPVATPAPTLAASTPGLLPMPTLSTDTGSPAPASDRVPTRVAVPQLKIDLPVVEPPNDPNHFPYCNVAEYIEPGTAGSGSQKQYFGRPGEAGTTYLYGHARVGMLLPLLDQSKINDGAAMLGMIVQVYTSDDRVYLYEVTQVRRHQSNNSAVVGTPAQQLALQTSEGPKKGVPGYTGLVLILVAQPLSSGPVDHALANPPANPVVCG